MNPNQNPMNAEEEKKDTVLISNASAILLACILVGLIAMIAIAVTAASDQINRSRSEAISVQGH